MLELENEVRSFMKSDYGDVKADKSKELNEDMSVVSTSPDEYTRKLHNLGGNTDA